jgi:hypothetical protein
MANPNNGLDLGIKQFNLNLTERPQNTQIPKITGTFVIGETVTAEPGNWLGEDLTYTYQFNDGVEGSSADYVLTDGDELTGLYVTVRASNNFGEVAATSVVYTVENLTNIDLPTITGTFVVGETVTADPGTWNLPNEDLTFEYSFNGGTAGASAEYELIADDVATGVEVTVTASSAVEDIDATSENYTVEAAE